MIYSSSGDLGDIIYQMCTVKAHTIEPVDFYLFDHPRKITTHGMNEEKAKSVASLLEIQPYIKKVIWTEQPADSPINSFRQCRRQTNVVRQILSIFDLDLELDKKPWMVLEDKAKCDVLIARSFRYRGQCPYDKIINKYNCSFVGFQDEYEDFCTTFGTIPWLPTQNLLELAKLINGCNLFIGNQSCPLAIAFALDKDIIEEVCLTCPNCVIDRDNARYCWNLNFVP
jgi:hypothetical protein